MLYNTKDITGNLDEHLLWLNMDLLFDYLLVLRFLMRHTGLVSYRFVPFAITPHAILGYFKSITLWYKGFGWSMCFSISNLLFNICSTVLLFFLRPVCSSARIVSVCGDSLFSVILSSILLG